LTPPVCSILILGSGMVAPEIRHRKRLDELNYSRIEWWQ
jgi:hypothetical protein